MGWFKEFESEAYRQRMRQQIDEEVRHFGEYIQYRDYGDYADDLARERLEERRNGPADRY